MKAISRMILAVSVLLLATGTAMAPPPQPKSPLDCTVSTTSVNFPGFPSSSTVNIDSQGTITLSCTCSAPPCEKQVSVTVDIGASNISGSTNPREMQREGNVERLEYQLYEDTARTNIFTTLTPAIKVKDGTPKVVDVYGRIPYYAARILLPAGSYTDGTVFPDGPTVTVTW
jgi:spore coat protein U-like protein